MSVHDRWKGFSRAEIAEARRKNLKRWQRRWRGPDVDPRTGKPAFHKQSYYEHQKAQAELDDARQRANPRARSIARGSVTVSTLLDRHLAAKADRAPKTVQTDAHHARAVHEAFGDRPVSTLDPTEIEIWSQRKEVARSSRKKEVEILRAAIRRGMRDKLVAEDPTEGIVVPLGHREMPHWSSEELMAVLRAAPSDLDRALLGVLGLMGPRRGEARVLRVGDYARGRLSITNSGAGSDTTKTRAGRRVLPVPGTVAPWLDALVDGRPKAAWLFESPRRKGQPIGERYISDALTRATARANDGRDEPIRRINVHGLRHTFAAISLGEVRADILAVSKAMGHAKPSITWDRYGHLAPGSVDLLMEGIDELASSAQAA